VFAKGLTGDQINAPEFAQPCCTALQIALIDLLEEWGVQPSAVIGHSSGEIAAAYAAKVLTAPEAIRTAYHRGQVARYVALTQRGGMMAIGLGRGAVTPHLLAGVVIGCENSPDSVTISGDINSLDQVAQSLARENPGVFCRALRVNCAYHSCKVLHHF